MMLNAVIGLMGSGYDPDALAFMNAAGLSSATQKNAINNFVLNLKGVGLINQTYNLWNKIKAAYPYVGGTANSHKFNLKNPADTNAAFRLTYVGTLIHNNSGATGTGVAYALMNLIPSTELTSNNLHIANYLGNHTLSANYYEMGIFRAGSYLYKRSTPLASSSSVDSGCNSFNLLSIVTNSRGTILSRSNGSTVDFFKDGVASSISNNAGSLPSDNFPVFALNENGAITLFSRNTHVYDSVGDGLTSAEGLVYHSCIEDLLTSLGR